MPRSGTKTKLSALDGQISNVAARRGKQRDIQTLVVARGIGRARRDVVGQLACLLLRHDVRQGNGDAIRACAVTVLDALANLRIGIQVPVELEKLRLLK